MTPREKAAARVERIEVELRQAKAQLKLVTAREVKATVRQERRALIALGEWLMVNEPERLGEALVAPDQKASLETLLKRTKPASGSPQTLLEIWEGHGKRPTKQ